jgi:serine/threonine-protein kinase
VPRRFIVSAPPAPPLLSSTAFQDLAISPNGRHLVYRARIEGAAGLYARAVDQIEGRVLPGRDLWSPFFSPDSAHVGFYAFTTRSLMRSAVLGGPPSRVTDSLDFLAGASWATDDQIVFATINPSLGILRVAAGGGRPEPLTRPGPGENHVMPESLPGDRGLLFTVLPAEGRDMPPQIAALDSRSGEVYTLMTGSHPRYATSGHLVYLLGNDLFAVRFDEQRLRLVGEPAPVLSGIEATSGFGQYSFSRDGALLVAMESRNARRELVWVDREGREERFPAQPRAYTYPRISPDGRRIALNARETNRGQIFVWDTARAAATPLLSGPGESDLYPVWTADGERLAYISGLSARHQLRLVAVGSAGPGDPVASGFELRAPYFLSPSGTELVYARQGSDGLTYDVALWKTPLGQDAEPVLLLGGARNADLSPHGRFIVYQANQTGRFEVYVRSFPNIDDQHVKVSTAGGIQPVWSPRNDELFYVEPGSPSHLMSVSVDAGADIVVSRPRPLLEWPYFQAELGRTYDVSRPDGNRFLAIRNAGEEGGPAPPEARVEIVLDWFDLLDERVLSSAG